MQKEDLLRRMRLFVTLTTVLFVVLVVGLLVQFGFIAYYHRQMTTLQERNAKIEKELGQLQDEYDYWTKGEGSKDQDITG